jgi:hypothetical protein
MNKIKMEPEEALLLGSKKGELASDRLRLVKGKRQACQAEVS